MELPRWPPSELACLKGKIILEKHNSVPTSDWSMHFSSYAQAFTLWRETPVHSITASCTVNCCICCIATLCYVRIYEDVRTPARFQGLHKAKRTLAHYGWQKINSFTAKSAHHSTQQSGADRFPMPSVCKHHQTWSLARIHTHKHWGVQRCIQSQVALWNATYIELTASFSDVITPPTRKRSHTVIIKPFTSHFYWFPRAVTSQTWSWPFHHPVHTRLSVCGVTGGGVHMAAFTHWHTLH